MANRRNTIKPQTGRLEISNVPLDTLDKIDKKVERLGTTLSGYVKQLINADLKGDKMNNFNNAG